MAHQLLTLKEAADFLRKSEAQLRWMVHNGSAPRSAKIAGRRMFRQADLDEFIENAFAAEAAAS